MHVTQLTPADPRWADTVHATRHDFYTLPGYAALTGRVDRGEPVGVLVEDGASRLLLPLLLREIPGVDDEAPPRDAVSPYGYPGLVIDHRTPGEDASAFAGDALRAAVRSLAEGGIVSAFVRMNPLLPVDGQALSRVGTIVDHGRTVSIDLTRDEPDLFRELRSNHRRNIARLDKLGFTYDMETDLDERTIDDFLLVYTETMDRLGAAPSYYVDRRYLRELSAALDGRIMVMLVRLHGEAAAAGLFTEVDGIVQYHLGGTRTSFLSWSPNKGMFTRAAHWARPRGNRILHLGGGLGGREDALFDFKAGFSPDRHPFRSLRIIIDPVAYGELARRWEERSGSIASPPDGFFPAYRAPVIPPAVAAVEPVLVSAEPSEV